MLKSSVHKRLPRNFHRTFKPERRYIHALLRYASMDGEGDQQAIATATKIPTGASSGKVPAILDYARGMGLIRLDSPGPSAIKKPRLTSFGRAVFLEDPFMRLGVSQWIAHLHLCGPITGADIWYHVFFGGAQSLGNRFTREKLETHLSVVYGTDSVNLIGPLIGTYDDDAAFKTCSAIELDGGTLKCRSAPLGDEFGRAYGAWILQLIHIHFPLERQVSVTALNVKAGWRTIPGWNAGSQEQALSLIERKGIIDIDRQMEPWLIRPKMDLNMAWKQIFTDLI